MEFMLTLSDAENAIVDVEKPRDYCLNPDHPRGKHKDRVFRKVLGYVREDAEVLRDQIKKLIVSSPCEARKEDKYGKRYKVEMVILGKGGEGFSAYSMDLEG